MNRLLLLLALVLMVASSEGKTLVVDSNGQGHPVTLEDAVLQASPGDEIVLMPGSYPGATIDRRLSISGSGRVVINGRGNSALIISASGCRISNISVEGSGSNPLVMIQSPDNVLECCIFRGGLVGVEIQGANNTIRDSQIDSSLGIKLMGSRCSTLNNTFKGDKGIQMKDSTGNIIEDCRFLTSWGMDITASTNNRFVNNSLSGTGFGIALIRSSQNWLAENQISGTYLSGLDLLESSANNVSKNRLDGCKLGISLRQSDKNYLTDNTCSRNERAGIYLNGSYDNQLIGNALSENGNGVLLFSSLKNKIISNQATSNTYGISLRKAGQNVLKNNSLSSNQYNMRIDSASEIVQVKEDFVQDIDLSNTADAKPICYLVGEKNRTVPDGCGFIGLIECQNIKASNQNISNSSAGILMVGSTGCHVGNCTIQYSEAGISLINSKGWRIEKCKARRCEAGFKALKSSDGNFMEDHAVNCSEIGFEFDGAVNLTLNDSTAMSNNVGISVKNSQLCRVQNSTATKNNESGVELTSSSICSLRGVEASLNKKGINLVGSNGCQINDCHANLNIQDGLALVQLSTAIVRGNTAMGNGQGIYVQSSKSVLILGNNLSANSRQGLKLSSTSECNVTDNNFIRNRISGANLVDCRENYIYHNIFIKNGYQEAVDNGENQWDAGPKVGGNYWSDFKANGNPGNIPRQIQTKGVDKYPFRDPGGWM